MKVSEALTALASHSPDHRKPPGRALPPRAGHPAARLTATAQALDVPFDGRFANTGATVYHSPTELAHDLQVIADSLCAHGSQTLAAGRLRDVIRAVEVLASR